MKRVLLGVLLLSQIVSGNSFSQGPQNFQLLTPALSDRSLPQIDGGAAFRQTPGGVISPSAVLPSGFNESTVAAGLNNPVAMQFAPDGRLFVTLQSGVVRIIKNGTLLSQPFLNIGPEVDSSGERGLFGIAFDPDFSTKPYVYIYYTANSPGSHNRVSRFTASGDAVVPGSEVVLLELDNLGVSTFHNGGDLHFGGDGKLYISAGDGSISEYAPSFNKLMGKILRINGDGTIPVDNPFYDTLTGSFRAIWALGLRNPFKIALQPGTGRMFINDVGQDSWEEINDGIAGSNYGWPATEGYTTNPNYRSPVYAYLHGSDASTGCSITGGDFYNPAITQFPADYVGKYFFADYCSGWIRRFDPGSNAVLPFVSGIASPVDLKVGTDGALYYLARGSGGPTGAIYKITYSAGQPTPTPTPTPQPAIDVYLSDIAWAYSANGWGPVERDKSNGEKGAGDGQQITLNGAPYAKGLGAHAASEVRIELGGRYSNFVSDVGVDDEVGSNGSVVFQVWADGVNLYDSGLMTGSSGTKSVNLSVSGKQELRLIVTDGGVNINSDHADWAGARLTNSSGQSPAITTHPAPQTVASGQAATFSVVASGTAPLSYQWQRGGSDITGATASSYTTAPATTGDSGARFRCVVTNTYGSITSNDAVLTVTNNQAPVPVITSPAEGVLYGGGDTISYAGAATDAEDGTLPASAYSWVVDFHHDTHIHPFIGEITGVKGGTFTIPTAGETSANVWYRINLTVIDSNGARSSTFRDILPRKSTLTLTTNPPGLQLTLDGQPRTAPYTFEGVEGITRSIGAISPQTAGGVTYQFVSWSDGGAATHDISTPVADTTYTAAFAPTSTPGVLLSDNFDDNVRDSTKWSIATLNDAPADFDPLVSVIEQNSRLNITPRSGVYGMHYGGYVSVQAWDLSGRQALVEVVQVTNVNDWADTVFAIGIDSQNWFRFVKERNQLYFQTKVGGVKTSTNVAYDPAQQRFWRFRHDAATDQVLFETSADGVVWVSRRAVSRGIPVAALRVELSAGTFNWNDTPGTAVFDNLLLKLN